MVFPAAGIVRHSTETVKRAKVVAVRNSKNLQSMVHSWKTIEPDNPVWYNPDTYIRCSLPYLLHNRYVAIFMFWYMTTTVKQMYHNYSDYWFNCIYIYWKLFIICLNTAKLVIISVNYHKLYDYCFLWLLLVVIKTDNNNYCQRKYHN